MYTDGSNEFNQMIESVNSSALHHRIVFLDDSTEIVKINKAKGYISSNKSSELQIGTTNMAYMEIEVVTDKLLTNREFRFESGVKLADGTIEYAPIGYFTIQKPDGDLDYQKFTAYDRMQKFERLYSSALSNPTNTALIVNEICTICGVELATPIDEPIPIEKNLQGYTCREVLGYVSALHGKFACIDRFGKLNIRWYSEIPIDKEISLIWSFTKSQKDFSVDKIEISKDSETNFTSGSGFGVIYHSNPLATQTITDNIFSKLNGFTYNASVIQMLDDIRLDPWDIIKVTYLDGEDYLVPCMFIEQNFTDGSTLIESYAKSDAENEYRFTGPTINYLNRMATELLLANRVIATKVDAEYVNSHAITTDNLDAIKAEIQTLIVDEIDGKYADIHLANIDILDVGQFFADSGIVRDMVIVDGKVTGVLDSVTINANNITSGTLTTDRLVIRGTDKSIVYELNNIDGALQAVDVDTLNGEIITPRTINADRIIAESITANELATESITSDKIVAGAITAEKLAVDAIMSNNYVEDTTGSFLNLEDGSFDSKHLKWDKYGNATITDLNVLNTLNFGSGVYPDYVTRPVQYYLRAQKYTGGYMSNIIKIGYETWDNADNPTTIVDDTVIMSVYGGYQYGVEFPITVHAKNLGVYNLMPYEERDRETGAILSRSGSIGTNSGRFPSAFIEEITCNNINVDGYYQEGQGNIDARGYIRTQSELISKGTLTVDGKTTLKGQLVAEQGMYVNDTGMINWGTAGYIVLARLEIKGNWLSNEQIRFKVKGLSHYGEIIIAFSNQTEVLATTVSSCTRNGNLPHVYYSRTVGSNSVTIDIIVEKQQYQEFVIENYVAGYEVVREKVNIAFPNTFESTLRSGAVEATQGTDYFQNVEVAGNINTNDVIVGYGTTGQSSVLRLSKGIVKGGAGEDYLLRVTEMNLNFSNGVATVDMTPYLTGSSFKSFVLAQLRQAQSTVVTAARIEGTTLYVQATALSGTPYTGGAWVNILFLMNI